MSEVSSQSRATMAEMFGRQPELNGTLNPLQETDGFEEAEALIAQLPESERTYLSSLAKNLPWLLESIALAVGEEEAARFLYNAFGLPEPEILELATPVHLDLLEKLTTANDVVENRARIARISLAELIKNLEKVILTSVIIKLEKLEREKQECEASLKTLEETEPVGQTAAADRLEWLVAHQEKLANLEKEIHQVEFSLGEWFELVSSFRVQQQVVSAVRTPDIAAPNPTLVYSRELAM